MYVSDVPHLSGHILGGNVTYSAVTYSALLVLLYPGHYQFPMGQGNDSTLGLGLNGIGVDCGQQPHHSLGLT